MNITKADIVILYTIFVSLYDKGYSKNDILTKAELDRLFELIDKNDINDDLENIILLETLDDLLRKTGVRFGDKANYIH